MYLIQSGATGLNYFMVTLLALSFHSFIYSANMSTFIFGGGVLLHPWLLWTQTLLGKRAWKAHVWHNMVVIIDTLEQTEQKSAVKKTSWWIWYLNLILEANRILWFKNSSVYKWPSTVPFQWLSNISCVLHLLCPFICQWLFRLLLCPGCCK